jgi:hypothetical protein
MFLQAYRAVMDPTQNPLRRLPKVVRFQYMTILAYMWSAIFALWIGYTWLIGPSVVAHSLLLVGLFFTSEIFGAARRGQLYWREEDQRH